MGVFVELQVGEVGDLRLVGRQFDDVGVVNFTAAGTFLNIP